MHRAAQDELIAEMFDRASAEAEGEGAAALASALGGLRVKALAATQERFETVRAGVPCSRFVARMCDFAVRGAVEATVPADRPREDRGVAFVATGGYGRGMISIGSTIRLTVLHGKDDPEAAHQRASQIAAVLDSAGFRTAIAACTICEFLERLRDDLVGAAPLLDTRRVCGSRRLHAELQRAVRSEFLPAYWGSFGEEVLREVLSRRDPTTGSPYCTEPNLKEGAGCLRDIGAAQRLHLCVRDLPSLVPHLPAAGSGAGLLTASESAQLRRAVDFILKVRNRLHALNAGAFDTLHRPVQDEVARAAGFEGRAATPPATEMLQELFSHTGRASRLIRMLGERFRHLHRVAWLGTAYSPPRALAHGFVEVAGRIHAASAGPESGPEAPLWMMRLFALSQRRHLPVSQTLLGQVAAGVSAAGNALCGSRRAGEAFLGLLAGSVGVSDRVAWMRDSGLLQAYLPEFAPLVHRVEPEIARELTLDEYAVESLRVIDELAHTDQPDELAQRQILGQTDRPDLLRLALLLHDASVGTGSDSTVAADAVAQRMGLRRRDREELTSVMHHRDVLPRLAETEGETPGAELVQVARAIGSADRLRMLYLLAYARARAEGSGWFAWRSTRLFERYQSMVGLLVPGHQPFATADHFDRGLAELCSREGLTDEAAQFAALVPRLYKTEVTPAEALGHMRMLSSLGDRPAIVHWTLGEHDARVWVCTSDVPARFAQVVGALTRAGLDILDATAFTLRDGTVLDRFLVQMRNRPINPDPTFWKAIEDDLVLALTRGPELARAAQPSPAAATAAPPLWSHRLVASVRFAEPGGVPFTVMEVTAHDRPGLLLDISRTLADLGLNMEFARIVTRGEVAKDAFYVTDAGTGNALADPKRMDEIRERLLAVVG
jgi:[protein-PII] uridylyltransferase